jgi:hypothetical protein
VTTYPIDLTPLLHGADPSQLRVAGVALHEAAAGVNRDMLTDASYGKAGSYRQSNGTLYRQEDDGSWRELPLAERVEATVEGSGWLKLGDVTLGVKDGVVSGISVRGPSLATLGIRDEADIQRTFGSPAGWDWVGEDHRHHYPARGVVFGWGSNGGQLSVVHLGESSWRDPQLGAPDLLAEIVEHFGGAGWSTLLQPSADEGQGIRFRRERVAALCRALGLGEPANVVSGDFLPVELDLGRARVMEEIRHHNQVPWESPFRCRHRDVFRRLLNYRNTVEGLIRYTSSWLEVSEPTLVGMIREQDRIGRELKVLVKDIDRWICTLIDPEGRSFPLRELIVSHGWPDVDLRTIELDER